MAASCEICGRGLSLGQRARGRSLCDSCTAEAHAALTRASADYEGALSAVLKGGGADQTATDRLRQLEQAISSGGGDFLTRKAAYYRSFLDHVLADEVLTADEEAFVNAVGAALYPGEQEPHQMSLLSAYRSQLFVAMVNDGRLPEIRETRMVLKKGEVLHLEEPAQLVKEVIQREFQSGSRGVSFRIMKGVSYRVGASRGRMVEVGRSIEPVDDGAICVTSLRAVYTGERKTMEIPYAKLLDINVYTDGIQFHVTGRQNPPMFRVASGPMIAAAINTAMQRRM